MINRLIDRVLNAKPVNIGLLLLLMPFITGIVNAILALILLFMGYEFIIHPFSIAIAIDVIVYFLWIWGIAVKKNNEQLPELQIETRWFKVCFWVFFSYCLLSFVLAINLESIPKGFYLDNDIISALETISGFYGLAVFVSYGYLALFTAKVIRTMERKHEATMADSFPYAFMVWVFPIGIPLLQAKLKSGFDIHDFMRSRSPFR
jgi:hypothetical protein